MKNDYCKFYVIENNIYAYISLLKKRENRIRINTGYKIDKSFWDNERQKPKTKYSDNDTLKIALDYFKKNCNDVCKIMIEKYPEIDSVSYQNIKTEYLEIFNKNNKQVIKLNAFWESYNDFILYKTNNVVQKTIYHFKRIRTLLKDYEVYTKTEINFNTINEVFKSKFENFLISKYDFSDNYISKIFSMIREFMYYAYRQKYHTNLDYKYLTKPTNRADIFTLTEKEYNMLINFDYPNERLTKTRDLFVFQTEICQRFSDIQGIAKGNFTLDTDGDMILKVRQKKTDIVVNIPLSPIAISIVKKYNFELPKISNQKYNTYIKELCKLTGINELVTIHNFKGGKKEISQIEKYNMISSHTARRTGATLLLSNGIPIPMIMTLTGHKTISEFQKYIGYNELPIKDTFKELWKRKPLSIND